MSEKLGKPTDAIRRVMSGSLLAAEGDHLVHGLSERSVFLGPDGFVYQLATSERRGSVQTSIVGKRAVGEYLRWVDGLFRPGELPGEENGIHFRAARKLRELI